MSLVAQLYPPAVALQADSCQEQPHAPSSTPNQALLGLTPAESTLAIFRPVRRIRFSPSRTALPLRIDLIKSSATHCTLILFPDRP